MKTLHRPNTTITGIFLMAALAFAPGCSQKSKTTSLLQPEQYTVLKDQAYGDNSAQKMDIYLPNNRSEDSTPVIMLIHGGAWSSGDKKDMNGAIDSLLRHDKRYACFNINYRLARNGNNQYPAAAEDVQRALSYIWSNSKQFRVSQETVLLGISAGAHLAALQAYRHNEQGRIRAAVCIIGVYDLTTYYKQAQLLAKGWLINYLGGTPGARPERYQEASPVTYITNRSVPTLVIHGTEDKIAPLPQAQELVQKLAQAGVPHQLVTYKSGHGIPAESGEDALLKILSFLNRYARR